ncbi:MAG: DNA translocase FtsK [Chloroflexota bacterium]
MPGKAAKGKGSKTQRYKSPVGSKPPTNRKSSIPKVVPRAKTTPSAHGERTPPAPGGGLSLDRKLDIVGVLLVLLSVLTIIGLFSSSPSSLTGIWVIFWRRVLGWGFLILPLGLLALGLWLVLRNFKRVPTLSVERTVGIVWLYIVLLAWMHFFLFAETADIAFERASLGQGGGYIGAGVHEALRAALGVVGAAIALIAALLIGLALALDVSVADLFRWVQPFRLRLQDWWDEHRATRATPKVVVGTDTPSGVQGVEEPVQVGLPTPDTATSLKSPVVTPAREQKPRKWVLPPIEEMLEKGSEISANDEFDRQRAHVIEETLKSFGAPAQVVEINRGPTITQFGVEPDFIETRGRRTRVRVGKISALADDLALALAAKTIRVQAPVPGKGYVGIEVPNETISLVALRDIVESEAFKRLNSPLRIALGQDVAGNAVAADLTAMPHLLIAGATGSGKSVCVNSLICCLLMFNTPDDLRFVMVDPKRVELTDYNGIPHLLAPVVVDLERVVNVLKWVEREMDSRYHKFAEEGARNMLDYNQRMEARGERKLPYLIVVVDELADLMMLAPEQTERTLTRLAQLSRATGVHLIISTQRPSVDVVTGLIKANFPARVAFAVASGVDSRVILDQLGAERLLGRGDMLFQAPDAPAAVRLQGVYVTEHELLSIVLYWKSFATQPITATTLTHGVVDGPPAGVPLKQKAFWEEAEEDENLDPLFEEAVDVVRQQRQASISMLQRRLRIGYTRAARLIDSMEERGIVSPPLPNSQSREVLDYG